MTDISQTVSNIATCLVEKAKLVTPSDPASPVIPKAPSHSLSQRPWRPSLGAATWEHLIRNQPLSDLDTFAWDVLISHFPIYFYQHTNWFFQVKNWWPAEKFGRPPGESLASALQNTVEVFQNGGGDEETLDMERFSHWFNPSDLLNSPALSVRRKHTIFQKNYHTPSDIIVEFLTQNPSSSNSFITHPNYPLFGMPNEAGKRTISMNSQTLQQGWASGELDVEDLAEKNPFYMKSLHYGIGQFSSEQELENIVGKVQNYEQSLVLAEGLLRRQQPLENVGLLTTAIGNTIELSAGSVLPFYNWWPILVASRNPLSFQEVDILLTFAGSSLEAKDQEFLTAWLDEDGQLGVDDLDDLPARFRWDIRTAS